ncbi:hypothetical protein [Burkholderia ubonensis]|uniref:hypothetical protein n=1 Tax=Burkholderia ubonensis TaxID=101571 RepID=UPI00075A3065|nr:hypothetical protein [Burkholderia ubonensis]KVD70357.1 hypothetical protein WI88_30295 [Burkholderia ubonensis]
MLTEVGLLVSIVKNLFDIAKGGTDIFGRRQKATEEAVEQLKERITGLAEQLHQSVALSKMLPIWLKDHAEVDLFVSQLSDDDVRLLDSKLRRLISDSIHDHFSGTLFRTDFNCLPGVEIMIKGFRDRLLVLEQTLNGIVPGDAEAWRRTWPFLKLRMHDLRVEAVKVNNLADEIHSDLVQELRQSGA